LSKRPIKKNYYSPKRRAIYARGEKINHLEVFEEHNWICVVCDQKIDKHLRLPNLMAATLEHIVPLCKGGTHTRDNVGPAHARCNFLKGDRLDNPPYDVVHYAPAP
jgi:5-methylcytosine-specific restriction endonuclease McrA